MSAVTKNHRDAIALLELAHRSMDALDHEFQILSQLILQQTRQVCLKNEKKNLNT